MTVHDIRDTEEWRVIPVFDRRYEASNLGNIRHANKKKTLNPYTRKKGYKVFCLCRGNPTVFSPFTVHRAVALAFIPNPDGKPFINHIDADKTNNRISNLEWVTTAENQEHARQNGLYLKGSNHPRALINESQVSRIKESIRNRVPYKKIAAEFSVGVHVIQNIASGKVWKFVS